MKKTPEAPPPDSPDEIAIRAFRRSEQRLQDLLGGRVDAVMLEGGGRHLLRDAQEMLRQSEERFRNMFAASVTGMAISTPQGRFLEVNPAYCRMLGYTAQELLALNFAALTHPDDLNRNLDLRNEVLAGRRESFVLEKRYLRKDGSTLWINHSVTASRNASGEITSFTVIVEDIEERKAAELRLNRLNRLHAVLSEIAEASVRAQNRQELYDKICRIVVERGLLRMVFIAELDSERNFAVPAASFGEGEDYLLAPASRFSTDGGPLSQGPVGTSIRNGAYNVCNNIAAAARMQPWHDQARKYGLIANASFPFGMYGVIIGVLVLYADETDYFQADEIALMVTVAKNLTFALELFEKEQQRQRVEAEAIRLAAIVESSDDPIIGKNLDGIVTSWNRGAAKIFGYSAEQIAGNSMIWLVPLGQQDQENDILQRIKLGESVQNFETLRQAKDGRLINVSVTASPIRDSAGQVIGISEVAHDTTEASKSRARLSRLIDSNAQGVVFWNINGQIYNANNALLALLGYTRRDLEAGVLNWITLTPAEYCEIDKHALRTCIEQGSCKPYEKEYLRKDGSRVAILIGSAIFDDNREDGVSFVVDLTERKKLENQLRQAQKMEAIGNLAGGVAHDFNNILAVINIQADFLKNTGNLSEEQVESTEDIIAAVERAAAMTRQLLLFSSRETFQPRDINLSESIAGTFKMLKRLVGEQIETRLKLAAEPMFLHADPGMIDQVLLNLVVNARDAMPGGGQLVIETYGAEFDEFAVSLPGQARPGAFVCLSLSDTGCGIPAANIPLIFEPFFTTKEVGKGTGLGLATVFGIVHQHRGWINVYSEVGHGTTFRVYLPRLVKYAAPKASKPDLNARSGAGETILLVEDDPRLRSSVHATLSRLGYRVLAAQNVKAAMEVWKTHRDGIQLLLTDLVMPGNKTGKHLAQSLLADKPELKVVYMSGYSIEVFGTDFPVQEDVNFLTKPFAAARLAKILRRCLDRD